ncbi:EAL domain-containing protein [Rhodobacteraceae bacterium nBUS_24]
MDKDIKQANSNAYTFSENAKEIDSNVFSSTSQPTVIGGGLELDKLMFRHSDLLTEKHAYILQDTNFSFVFASKRFFELTGYTDLSDLPLPNAFYESLSENEMWRSRNIIEKRRTGLIDEISIQAAKRKDGSRIYIRGFSRWVETASKIKLLLTSIEDISDSLMTERFNNALLNQSSAIILTLNLQGAIQTCSDAWSSISGIDLDKTIGKELSIFCEHLNFEDIESRFEILEFHEKGLRKQCKLVTKNGVKADVIIHFKPFSHLIQGKQIIATISDISNQKALEKELRRRLNRDALTNLYSRRYLHDKFASYGRDADYSLSIIDLDYFKSINDRYGHMAGDELLSAIARNIQISREENVHYFRLGGDEFAIIREWRSWKDTKNFCQRILKRVAESQVFFDGHELQCSASIGAVFFERNLNLKEGLKLADLMLREAKKNGRNGCVIGDYSTIQELKQNGKFITIKEMQDAMENGEVEYFIQPVVDALDNSVLGFEALVRWIKSTNEVIEPRKFLDILHQTIRQPKYMALKAKMRHELSKKLEGYPNQFISYNLALEQVAYKDAANKVHSEIETCFCQASRKIILELSEKAMTDRINKKVIIDELMALKGFGYSIALDDFGIESSNLQRLRDFPIDIVKIDQSFIKNLGLDVEADNLLASLQKLIAELGIKIIVEGVETELQKEILLNLGLTIHQGFLYSRPVNTENLPDMFHRLGRNDSSI